MSPTNLIDLGSFKDLHEKRFANDPFLLTADILQANDSLTQVINLYRQLVKGEDVSKDGITTPPGPGSCVCV